LRQKQNLDLICVPAKVGCQEESRQERYRYLIDFLCKAQIFLIFCVFPPPPPPATGGFVPSNKVNGYHRARFVTLSGAWRKHPHNSYFHSKQRALDSATAIIASSPCIYALSGSERIFKINHGSRENVLSTNSLPPPPPDAVGEREKRFLHSSCCSPHIKGESLRKGNRKHIICAA